MIGAPRPGGTENYPGASGVAEDLELLDLPEGQQHSRAEISRRRARGEVRDLVRALGLSEARAGRA